MAFNAKNLHYDKNEPSFLRKLKGEFGNLDGRHNVQIARPKKDRLKTGDDDEDEPVIIDESGETIEKTEFERRVKGDEEKAADGAEGGEEVAAVDGSKESERQKVAEIGASSGAKKRKVVKVVGDVDDQVDDLSGKIPTQQRPTGASKEKTDKVAPDKKDAASSKKKAKKIKLSFDEPEG